MLMPLLISITNVAVMPMTTLLVMVMMKIAELFGNVMMIMTMMTMGGMMMVMVIMTMKMMMGSMMMVMVMVIAMVVTPVMLVTVMVMKQIAATMGGGHRRGLEQGRR